MASKTKVMKEGTKYDQDKCRMDLLPASLLYGVSEVLTHGARKYENRNWEKGISYMRIFGAILRHLIGTPKERGWLLGNKYDSDSGLPHLWHAACDIGFLIQFEEHPWKYKEFDDRPVHTPPEETKVREELE